MNILSEYIQNSIVQAFYSLCFSKDLDEQRHTGAGFKERYDRLQQKARHIYRRIEERQAESN
jgi:hypothetical protein